MDYVGAAYAMTDKNGANFVLEIIESPSLSSVLNVTISPSVSHSIYNDSSGNGAKWAGYEYNSGNGLEETEADWSVPAISGPGYDGSGTNTCDNGQDQTYSKCIYSFWVGETEGPGGYNSSSITGLAQGGTDSDCSNSCDGTSNGPDTYNMWIEFVNSTRDDRLPDTTDVVGSGDSIQAYVTVFPTNDYYVNVLDEHSGKAWSSYMPNGFGMGKAHYAQFMGETPGGYSLPDFSSFSVSGAGYYDDSSNWHTIGSGWTTEYVQNYPSAYQTCNSQSHKWNVCSGSVSSGDFGQSYLTTSGY